MARRLGQLTADLMVEAMTLLAAGPVPDPAPARNGHHHGRQVEEGGTLAALA